MGVVRDIGVFMLAGAATTVGVVLAHKGIGMIANPENKAKIQSKFTSIKNKFKKEK